MKIIRGSWYPQTTIGKIIHCDGDFLAWSLEDAIRAYGIKVYGFTGLSAGDYKIKMRYSPKFDMELPVIYTEDDGITAKNGGISFKYSMFHSGIKHEQTDGCVLNGINRKGKKIWDSATSIIIDAVKGGDTDLTIVNQKTF